MSAPDPAGGYSPGEYEFTARVAPLRAELLAHCYRMTGSVHDAEDLVQESLLRAWRAYDSFEHRSSIRTWMYRITTNACLNALERGPGRRVLPAGLGGESDDPDRSLRLAGPEVRWLQPIPDRMLHDIAAGDPVNAVISRENVRLAFIAALQNLSPRQRAILILRDVLVWPAVDVAEFLETSTVAVNGALLRARTTLTQAMLDRCEIVEPDDPTMLTLLERYVSAFERADIATLTDLLHADAQVQMPPHTTWFRGRDAIIQFFTQRVAVPGQLRMIATRANNQPAFGIYRRAMDGSFCANSLHVLSFGHARIHTIVSFIDPELLGMFALPAVLPG